VPFSFNAINILFLFQMPISFQLESVPICVGASTTRAHPFVFSSNPKIPPLYDCPVFLPQAHIVPSVFIPHIAPCLFSDHPGRFIITFFQVSVPNCVGVHVLKLGNFIGLGNKTSL
jgi:hypothetical protein